jgi:cation:H+ antiporter
LPILIWSAEHFINSAEYTAGYFGISPLFVEMFIISFGTSAPEIIVKSEIVRKELPVLLFVTFLVVWQLFDLELSHDDAFALLGIFVLLISWSGWQAFKQPKDQLAEDITSDLINSKTNLKPHLVWLVT